MLEWRTLGTLKKIGVSLQILSCVLFLVVIEMCVAMPHD